MVTDKKEDYEDGPFWGYETLIDSSNSPRELVTSPKNVELFLKTLVDEIGMEAYGEPQVLHFGEGNKAGVTGIQLITTSCLTLHACDYSGDIYFNCFSCKPYDVKIVEKVYRDFFKPERIRVNYLTRQA